MFLFSFCLPSFCVVLLMLTMSLAFPLLSAPSVYNCRVIHQILLSTYQKKSEDTTEVIRNYKHKKDSQYKWGRKTTDRPKKPQKTPLNRTKKEKKKVKVQHTTQKTKTYLKVLKTLSPSVHRETWTLQNTGGKPGALNVNIVCSITGTCRVLVNRHEYHLISEPLCPTTSLNKCENQINIKNSIYNAKDIVFRRK